MGVVHVRRDCICYIIFMALSLCSQIFIYCTNSVFKLTKSKFRIMPTSKNAKLNKCYFAKEEIN